jgi:hypothetical protein
MAIFVSQQDMWWLIKYNATMWHFNIFHKKENNFSDSYAVLAFSKMKGKKLV